MVEEARLLKNWICVKSLFFSQPLPAPPPLSAFQGPLGFIRLWGLRLSVYESPNSPCSTHRLFLNGPLFGESLGDYLHLSTFHTACILFRIST